MRVHANAAFVYAVCVVAVCYDVGLCALCRACGAPCFGEVLTLMLALSYIGYVEYFVCLTRQRVCVTCAGWYVRRGRGRSRWLLKRVRAVVKGLAASGVVSVRRSCKSCLIVSTC